MGDGDSMVAGSGMTSDEAAGFVHDVPVSVPVSVTVSVGSAGANERESCGCKYQTFNFGQSNEPNHCLGCTTRTSC